MIHTISSRNKTSITVTGTVWYGTVVKIETHSNLCTYVRQYSHVRMYVCVCIYPFMNVHTYVRILIFKKMQNKRKIRLHAYVRM